MNHSNYGIWGLIQKPAPTVCFYALIFFSFILLLAGCKKKPDVYQLPYMESFKNLSSDSFSIVFLSSIEGHVEPCGCTSNPLGGIARFATIYDEIKIATKNRVSLIDAGNSLFDSKIRNNADKCQDDERIALLLKTLTHLGLQITVPGPLDNAGGIDFRNNLYKKYKLTPLIPQKNITTNNHSVFMKITTTPSYEIGFLGVVLEDISLIDNIKKEIEHILKNSTSTKTKAIIAISQMPLELTKMTFNGMSAVDIVIQGQPTSFEIKTPLTLKDGPLLVEGGKEGQYLTFLILQNLSLRKSERIILDDRAHKKSARIDLLSSRVISLQKQIATAKNEKLEFLKKRLVIFQRELADLQQTNVLKPLSEPSVIFQAIPITKKIAAEPTVNAKLLQYEKDIPSLVKKCEENIACPKAEANTATYVGVNTCKTCHTEAFEVWKKAIYQSKSLDDKGHEITRLEGHSKAWQTLVDAHKDADRSCIGCHSTGFMKPGGYCKAFDVGNLKDVQCEVCHGPGSLHAASGDKRFITRNVTEETCRSCHHVPHIESYESFNYHEKLIRILGKGHGEKLLKELTHKSKGNH